MTAQLSLFEGFDKTEVPLAFVIIPIERVSEIFSDKLLAAGWLERYGADYADQHCGWMVRTVLQDVYTKLMEGSV
jgi:hypothetical protein